MPSSSQKAVLLLVLLLCTALPARSQDTASANARLATWLTQHLDRLVKSYEHFHAHPELSLAETETAARIARELEDAKFRVTRKVGGTGVVAVLENGSGPTVLIRGDMDALPVREETGLAYASRVEVARADGSTTGVMHACGHDIHVTNLIGTARFLASARDLWRGTLVVIAQPAEELGRGALAMMEDGLFDRFPRPDFTVALHVESELAAGDVGYTSGWSHANVDAVDIRVFGRGGHGARPHTTVDPIVVAAHLVTQLQTIVSRRIDPLDPAVVTVGSIQGGHKHNVIPDEVALQLTVRSYSDEVRNQLLEAIGQISRDTCRSFLCPREPEVAIREHYTPAVYADPDLVARAVGIFERVLGPDHVIERRASMGGEDFGRYARTLEIPGIMYRLGSVDPAAVRASRAKGGAPLPSLHSSRYAPLPRPTLHTGITTMSSLVLSLLAPD